MPYDPRRHGPERIVGPGFFARVWDAVGRVPSGRVTTYGDVAQSLGLRTIARKVGHALAALPAERDDVPWHRVVDAQGRITRAGSASAQEQRRRLEREDVAITRDGRVREFERLRWRDGDGPMPRAAQDPAED